MSFVKKKKYGQNFLTSDKFPLRIAHESGIEKEDGALEIGAGFGILTEKLANVAKKVVSVEIDEELLPILNEKFADRNNIQFINSDILKVDVKELVNEHFPNMEVCVCANLPYYITTPILEALFESGVKFKSITVMVQKEVADRICSKAGSAEYSSFTAYVSYFGVAKKLFTVPPSAFSPPPKVTSAVIQIIPHKEPPVNPKDVKLFFKVLNGAFENRRKTLVNSLFTAFSGKYSKEILTEAVETATGNKDIRGEALDIQGYSRIADILYEK
ncbi:MAG: ribosomal RNA small subunit methyltransferase A [Ruminococcaceae bacterium]|nr:ribosomal RNA small subunit methyltransferase A [Oscillospiraceae bacterium]